MRVIAIKCTSWTPKNVSLSKHTYLSWSRGKCKTLVLRRIHMKESLGSHSLSKVMHYTLSTLSFWLKLPLVPKCVSKRLRLFTIWVTLQPHAKHISLSTRQNGNRSLRFRCHATFPAQNSRSQRQELLVPWKMTKLITSICQWWFHQASKHANENRTGGKTSKWRVCG